MVSTVRPNVSDDNDNDNKVTIEKVNGEPTVHWESKDLTWL